MLSVFSSLTMPRSATRIDLGFRRRTPGVAPVTSSPPRSNLRMTHDRQYSRDVGSNAGGKKESRFQAEGSIANNDKRSGCQTNGYVLGSEGGKAEDFAQIGNVEDHSEKARSAGYHPPQSSVWNAKRSDYTL